MDSTNTRAGEAGATARATARLAGLLTAQAGVEGMSPTGLPGVEYLRSNRSLSRHPIEYDPSIVIVAQGGKRGYLGEREFAYDPGHYLVLAVPLPFECEVLAAPGAPFLGLSIGVDPAALGELLAEMDEAPAPDRDLPCGVYTAALDPALAGAAVRLAECLGSPRDRRVLGPQVVREILYRVLCGEGRGALRALASRHGGFGRVARALRRMHRDFDGKMDVPALAEESFMSVSAFHRAFKAVTGTSPVQYLKGVRLHQARRLMVREGLSAAEAAGRVGYSTASQFSREFHRFFGAPPRAAATIPTSRP